MKLFYLQFVVGTPINVSIDLQMTITSNLTDEFIGDRLFWDQLNVQPMFS